MIYNKFEGFSDFRRNAKMFSMIFERLYSCGLYDLPQPCRSWICCYDKVAGGGVMQLDKKWVRINTYENTIFRGMNIHKSQLF